MVNQHLKRMNKDLQEQIKIMDNLIRTTDRLDQSMKRISAKAEGTNNKRQLSKRRSNVFGTSSYAGGI